MPDDTTILSLPLILPAQAQKHVTHNEALVQLDLIVQLAVINRTLTTAPALAVVGDRHIVAAGATGVWAGQSGRIALLSETGWQFTQPLPGWRAHVLSEGQTAVFDGLAWETPADGPLSVTQLGVSATPDATNRLSVASPATLLNHAGAGHQLKLNKAAPGDTASLLFQTGFSGRAEMGTAGSDDFSVKVSADGSGFATALTAAAATGEVTLPQPVHLGGQAADPALPADGTLWLNTTTGEVKVRSAGATLPVGGGGGGLSDGEKGDITVSGAGAVWTIDAGAVGLGKLADIATDSFLGRDTAGSGSPEVLTPAQARGILNVADGATANASDAALRDRATHTGTQTASTISNFGSSTIAVALTGFAVSASRTAIVAADTILGGFGKVQKYLNDLSALAFSGDAGDLAGTKTSAFISDFSTAVSSNAAVAANTAKVTNATHTGDVTGATTLTLATVNANVGSFGLAGSVAQFVVNAKGLITSAVNVAISITASAISDSTAAGRDMLTAASAAAQTALLSVFSPGAKGLVPDPVTSNTTDFLRRDGTWATPAGGGGSPGGATGEVQYNNAGAFAGAADVEIEGGQLRLPFVAAPAAPAAGGLKLVGSKAAEMMLPGFIGPNGGAQMLQPLLGSGQFGIFLPASATTVTNIGMTPAAVGTATAANFDPANVRGRLRRIEYLVTTAATTAIASWRNTSGNLTVGGTVAGRGGFYVSMYFGPATGLANATRRGFCGLHDTGAPTDADPSTLTSVIGIAFAAADTNLQFIHNDAAGTATKIDLGAAFPKPSVDRGSTYRLELFSPPGTTQSVSYTVTLLETGAVATGTVTTDLPSTAAIITTKMYTSVGGTSSVTGFAVGPVMCMTEVSK
ncbi:MAG: hypothetical protein C0524_08080 [Rhodobacter sp.]|nr:hypothetical protein [Rhodobacter sp.]